VAVLWLSVIVLLPLAAMTFTALSGGVGDLWEAITAPAALAALRVTLIASAVVAVVNVVMGTLVAWVLVRDDFRGKGLVNALIDLPFALPTIVASIVLLSLYGPYSPIGVQLNATTPGLAVALAFVTLPFVVRAVQPVLLEADREVEEAAASLGASNLTVFRRVVLPTLLPAVVSGGGLAFARAIGEYGSGRPHRREHPGPDPSRLAVHPAADRDRPSGQRGRRVGGAAAGGLRRALPAAPACRGPAAARGEGAVKLGTGARLTARTVALAYLTVLVVLPVAVISGAASETESGRSSPRSRRPPPSRRSTCPC
jgi:ABC-type sulfate transport system permease subunit